MADGNGDEYKVDSSTEDGDESPDVTKEQLSEVDRKKEPCCCVPGKKKEKCEPCRKQQCLNSKAYRERLHADLTRYKKERDEERNKNASLQGQFETYQSSFTDALQQISRLCSNCGIAMEPVMLAGELPSEGTFAAHAKTELSDCEKFLRGLKNRQQTRKNPRAREACTACTDETCAACKKKKKDRTNAQKSRDSRQQDFTKCQKHLRWAIEYIHQQEKQKAELSWQNAQMKQLLTRRCHNCGWAYEEVPYAPVDPRPTELQGNPSQGPSTSGLAVGGGFQQQGLAASQFFTPASSPPESTLAQPVGSHVPGPALSYDDMFGFYSVPRPTDFQVNPSQRPSTSVLAVGGGFELQVHAAHWSSQYLTPASTPPETAQSVGRQTPGPPAAYDDMYRVSPEEIPIYQQLP